MAITTTTAIATAAVGKLFSGGGSLKSGSFPDEFVELEEIFVSSGITSDSILHHIFQELSWFGLTFAENMPTLWSTLGRGP
jgi:hypothetical protein